MVIYKLHSQLNHQMKQNKADSVSLDMMIFVVVLEMYLTMHVLLSFIISHKEVKCLSLAVASSCFAFSLSPSKQHVHFLAAQLRLKV